jgi:hypothetical protein
MDIKPKKCMLHTLQICEIICRQKWNHVLWNSFSTETKRFFKELRKSLFTVWHLFSKIPMTAVMQVQKLIFCPDTIWLNWCRFLKHFFSEQKFLLQFARWKSLFTVWHLFIQQNTHDSSDASTKTHFLPRQTYLAELESVLSFLNCY